MWDWKIGRPPFFTLGGHRQQRPDEAVQLVLRAVIGVQPDVDRVILGDLVGVRGQSDRTGHLVLDRGPGRVLSASGGYLKDAVRACFREALQGGVQSL